MKVAVVGAGVIGAMASWQLAERGAQVVLHERFGVAHDRGSSHGRTRIFRRALFEGAPYVPLINRSAELWAELGRRDPRARMTVTGGLTIGPDGGPIVRDALAAADAAEVAVEVLDAGELHRRFPQHVLLPGDVGVYEPGAGVLPAEECVRAAVAQARRRDATVRSGDRVTGVRTDGAGVLLETSLGTERADAVVLAAGAELPALVPDLDLPLVVEQSMHVWFRTAGTAADERWSGDRFPIFVRESGSLNGWGIGDTGDGMVKIGLTDQKPEVADLQQYLREPPRPTAAALQRVSAFVRAALDGLHPEPVVAVSCLNTFTPDGDFVLGPHPADPRIVIAGAGSGHSFKHAPAIAQAVAELTLTGTSSTPIGAFAPTRFGPPPMDTARPTDRAAGPG